MVSCGSVGPASSAGQTQTKDFASSEKARAAADRLIREKTGKGYVETTPPVATRQAVAFEPIGAHDLKGVPGEWHLFRVVSDT